MGRFSAVEPCRLKQNWHHPEKKIRREKGKERERGKEKTEIETQG